MTNHEIRMLKLAAIGLHESNYAEANDCFAESGRPFFQIKYRSRAFRLITKFFAVTPDPKAPELFFVMEELARRVVFRLVIRWTSDCFLISSLVIDFPIPSPSPASLSAPGLIVGAPSALLAIT
jgi:hypothetical protein